MRRSDLLDGPIPMKPHSTVSLRADPAGGPVIEIPKDLDQKVIDHIGSLAVGKFKDGLPKPPEKYDVKLPKETILPEEVLVKASTIAREMGITDNAHAQRIVDFLAEQVSGVAETAQRQFKETVTRWEDTALKAPDLGNGDPKRLQAHVVRVKGLLTKFFPESARKLLDEHGIGSHPDFIRGLSKIADLAKEDVLETGSIGGGKKSAAEAIYPKQAGKK